MNKQYLAFAVVAAIFTNSIPVQANEPTPDTVIVTATRTTQTVDESLATVTVITRTDIERSQAKSAAELLNGITGIETSVNGGYGKSTSVYLRGTNADHLIVLVDGVRLGSATLGSYSWEFLPIDQIERIEIVRGPRSSLYGPDAIGGVIQIFTRKGQSGLRAGASVGRGSFNSSEISTNVSGASEGTHYSVATARFATDGINARTVAAANEPDKDGYRNNSASAQVGHRFASGTALDAHLFHAQGHTEYDGNPNETDFIQNAIVTELRAEPMKDWTVKLKIAHSRDETDNFHNGAYSSTFNTIRRSESWQNDVVLAQKQLLTLGVDHQKDLLESSTSYDATSRKDVGYFIQHQTSLGNHDVLIGLRRDDTYAYGAQDTGNLSWGYVIAGERLRLLAAYGTAFKAPTFNQLYYPNFGNPNVKPEESESFELGLRGKEAKMKWSVRAFETNVDNLIATVCDAFFNCAPQNINRARIRGLEIETSVQAGNNNIGLNLTSLDPQDVETNRMLALRAKQSFRLDMEHDFGMWRLGGDWLWQSYRYNYDFFGTPTRMGGYGLVNLYARYDIAKSWFLKARAGNILDKKYETVPTYNSPGRNFFVTARYQYQ